MSEGAAGGSDFRRLHDDALASWYDAEPRTVEPGADLESIVLAQHFCNFRIWNLEDQARRTDTDDAYIAGIKRAIDRANQRRNDLMEKIDEALLATLDDADTSKAEPHSETAGMIVDRLSILALKIHHMTVNAARSDDRDLAEECTRKLAVLRRQRDDLAACLTRLLEDFREGRRFFKIYRQYKAYNDPRLNPALRGERGGRSKRERID